MWLLEAATAELRYFNGPGDQDLLDDGGYAILSHVWQGKEQSFQDIRALCSQPGTSPEDTPRSRASVKIRECCKLAESHGYRWAWIDTCCIDKTSSSELSEAINSMFQWYSKAAVCYAYLYDVSRSNLGRKSQFYKSRWFERGWTLQELIAPRSLLFYMHDWTILGTRTDMVEHLAKITKIDVDVLLHRRELGKVSIAQRMAWACQRKTTRVEDEAYCLMGIFGVNMPTIYGEGYAAFYRLQEEIMKISPDQTLFAWGEPVDWDDLLEPSSISESSTGSIVPEMSNWDSHCLLSSSPFDFWNTHWGSYKPEPIAVAEAIMAVKKDWLCLDAESEDGTPRPADEQRASEFTITAHGLRSTLPVIRLSDRTVNNCDLCIAVLGCRDACTGSVMGLLLSSLPERPEYQGDHKIFMSNVASRSPESQYSARLMTLKATDGGTNAASDRSGYKETAVAVGKHILHPDGGITWSTIHILHRPLPHLRFDFGGESRLSKSSIQHLEFSRWSDAELQKWGFQRRETDSDPVELDDSRKYYIATFASDAVHGEDFTITIGDCFCHPSQKSRWTTLVSFSTLPPDGLPVGSCSPYEHVTSIMASQNCHPGHMEKEQNWRKVFGNEDRAIELTINLHHQWDMLLQDWDRSSHYLLVDVKPSGSAYTALHDRMQDLKMIKTLLLRENKLGSNGQRQEASRSTIASNSRDTAQDDNSDSDHSEDSGDLTDSDGDSSGSKSNNLVESRIPSNDDVDLSLSDSNGDSSNDKSENNSDSTSTAHACVAPPPTPSSNATRKSPVNENRRNTVLSSQSNTADASPPSSASANTQKDQRRGRAQLRRRLSIQPICRLF